MSTVLYALCCFPFFQRKRTYLSELCLNLSSVHCYLPSLIYQTWLHLSTVPQQPSPSRLRMCLCLYVCQYLECICVSVCTSVSSGSDTATQLTAADWWRRRPSASQPVFVLITCHYHCHHFIHAGPTSPMLSHSCAESVWHSNSLKCNTFPL